jgi:hypothetical protein
MHVMPVSWAIVATTLGLPYVIFLSTLAGIVAPPQDRAMGHSPHQGVCARLRTRGACHCAHRKPHLHRLQRQNTGHLVAGLPSRRGLGEGEILSELGEILSEPGNFQ